MIHYFKKIFFILSFIFIISCKISQETPSLNTNNEPSMLLKFSFEETIPDIVYDSSSYKNHGILKGLTTNILFSETSNATLGKCYNWKNNNTSTYSHIVVNTPALIHDNEKEFSVSGWIFFQAAPSGTHYIITKLKGIDGQRTFFIRMSAATMQFYIYYGFASTLNSGITSATITANTWNHFVCTYKYITNGTSELRIYVNTVQSAVLLTAGGPLYKTNTPIVIGSDLDTSDNSTTNRFHGGTTHGKLDEIRYYNKALSLLEVTQMYYDQL